MVSLKIQLFYLLEIFNSSSLCGVSGGGGSEAGGPAADLRPVADASGGGAVGQQDAARPRQLPRCAAHHRVPARHEEHGGFSIGQLDQR